MKFIFRLFVYAGETWIENPYFFRGWYFIIIRKKWWKLSRKLLLTFALVNFFSDNSMHKSWTWIYTFDCSEDTIKVRVNLNEPFDRRNQSAFSVYWHGKCAILSVITISFKKHRLFKCSNSSNSRIDVEECGGKKLDIRFEPSCKVVEVIRIERTMTIGS